MLLTHWHLPMMILRTTVLSRLALDGKRIDDGPVIDVLIRVAFHHAEDHLVDLPGGDRQEHHRVHHAVIPRVS